MNYQKLANDFLKKTNVVVEIKKSEMQSSPRWAENDEHGIKYIVRLHKENTNPKEDFIYQYWDSFYNRQNKKRPTNYDVLACLQNYELGTFQDFCNEFDYEEFCSKCNTINTKNYNIYKSVVKEWENVNRIWTKEEIEELREIQ